MTTSPHQANGKAESAVKIAKGLITKGLITIRAGGDIGKAILEWRNTPTPGMDSSPVQRFMSRRTRSFLPCKGSLYQPEVQQDVNKQVAHKRRLAKKYYDRLSHELPPLVIGQEVRTKTSPQTKHSRWVPGIVKAEVAPRSYHVEVNGRKYRHNSVHIRDTIATGPDVQIAEPDVNIETVEPPMSKVIGDAEKSSPTKMNNEQSSGNVTPKPPLISQSQTTTRAGRVSKPPVKFQDYV